MSVVNIHASTQTTEAPKQGSYYYKAETWRKRDFLKEKERGLGGGVISGVDVT